MKGTVLVLGSGPIRIGQGIEFDYSCVHCVRSLTKLGYRPIIINNNPETVSTDFDTSDGLYFEPVTLDDVLSVIERESPIGVVCQFGGQTAINLAEPLANAGAIVLGTQPSAIATAEDREQFEALLEELQIARPKGKAVRSLSAAQEVAANVGFPVLVRPSFVLGGRAMEIIYSADQLAEFYQFAEAANPGQPVLVDQYIVGIEAEVDVISDGVDTLVPGIMEHIERAGVHSGDSMAAYPPPTLSEAVQSEMVRIACQIARKLQVRGLLNIQFVIKDEVVYIIEVNPRASRTVPYLSKVTGVPMVDLATRCMMHERLSDLGLSSGLWVLQKGKKVAGIDADGYIIAEHQLSTGVLNLPKPPLYAVKAPVFSFQKLAKVEPSLGPEMKSTGEVLGIDETFEAALYKAIIASGIRFQSGDHIMMSVRDEDKPLAVEVATRIHALGYKIAATQGTHDALNAVGIPSEHVLRIQDGSPNIIDWVRQGKVSLVINTPSKGDKSTVEAKHSRSVCIENGIACITNIDTAMAIAKALEIFKAPELAQCRPYTDYLPRSGGIS